MTSPPCKLWEVAEGDILVVGRILDHFQPAAVRQLDLAEIGSVRIYLADVDDSAQVKRTLQRGDIRQEYLLHTPAVGKRQARD